MLPLDKTLETISQYAKGFAERKEAAIRNTNPVILDAATIIYNTINNIEKFGDIVEDESLRKYTDTYDEMFKMDEEPSDVKVKNSEILDPTKGTVNTAVETTMAYWFHPSRDLLMKGLKDMGFIPAIYIGNMETDCDENSFHYTNQFFNKDKATIIIKLDNRYGGGNQDGMPPTVLLVDCIDCTNGDEFLEKIEEYCNKFKQMIISLRDLTPVESIQIFQSLSEEVGKIFAKMQERLQLQNTMLQK